MILSGHAPAQRHPLRTAVFSALDTASLVPANWGRAKVLQKQDTGWTGR